LSFERNTRHFKPSKNQLTGMRDMIIQNKGSDWVFSVGKSFIDRQKFSSA
jgi:hypothetical protein